MWRRWLVGLIFFGTLSGEAVMAQTADPSQVPADPKKFELYLLVGQSNMAGRGKLAPEDREPAERVLVLNKEDQWKNQGEPIHFDKPIAGVGLGFAFAKKMAAADPGVTIGLIPCAVGGTPIKRWMPGGDLFENAVRRARIAQTTGTLRGILWHQGESESATQDRASAYSENLAAVIEGFRRELNSPNLPVVVGELGEFLGSSPKGRSPFAKLVNEQIDLMQSRLKGVAVVSSAGLTHIGDRLHFDSPSQKEFGARYAAAMEDLQKNQGRGK